MEGQHSMEIQVQFYSLIGFSHRSENNVMDTRQFYPSVELPNNPLLHEF